MALDRAGEPSSNTDVLPMLTDVNPGFDSVLRGYDRAQVDAYLARLDADVRSVAAERDSASARTADLAAQLASAQAQVESLRRQLRTATENVTTDNVDVHVNSILKTAQNDAAALRASAHQEAETVRNGAVNAAARTRAAAQAEADRITKEATTRQTHADDVFRRRMAEIDEHKWAVTTDLTESLARTRTEETALSRAAEAERTRLETESAAERERLDAESSAHRAVADEDFELTLRRRRTAAYSEIETRQKDAEVEVARMVGDATRLATKLVDAARAEVRRLTAIRDRSHEQLRALHATLGRDLERSISTAPTEELARP